MDVNNIKNSVQAVIDGLTPLAQKLQIPIESLWTWGLKHNYAIATAESVGALLSVALFFVGVKTVRRQDFENMDQYDVPGWAITGIVLCIAAVLFGTCWGYDAIIRFIAPEFSTANDIIQLIK